MISKMDLDELRAVLFELSDRLAEVEARVSVNRLPRGIPNNAQDGDMYSDVAGKIKVWRRTGVETYSKD